MYIKVSIFESMATFAEYQKQLQAVIKDLNDNRQKETFLLASDAINRIRNRVIETGETATGGKFKPYSEMYKKIKGKTRQVAFRDFKFTNKMWRDIGPVNDGKTAVTQSYVLTARLAANRELIDKNIDTAGENFLELSKSEIDLLNKLNNERFVNTLKKHGIA